MEIFIIIVVIFVLLIIVIAKFTPEIPKPKSKNERIIEEANKFRQNYNYRPSDELYASVTRQHSNKTLEQIDEYIESHRKNNDSYWGRNRMEYKILMERQTVLWKAKDDNMRNLLASDKIYSLSYEELLPTYRLIRSNQHIYEDIDLVRITNVLDKLSFEKFSTMLMQKLPSAAVGWINARIREGEYISERLRSLASEIESRESEDVIYNRKLKNLKKKLSKAKKESTKSKIAEIQEELNRFQRKNL